MDHITLQKVDESNFLACFSLRLEAQQEKFVSHPIRSLAQAYVYYSQCTPFAVCRAGQVVGYLMVIYDYDEEAYFIWHLMIDAQHQGRGCGRAAMEAALAYIRKPRPPAICTRPCASLPPAGRTGMRSSWSGCLTDLRPMRRPSASADCITVIILFPKTMLS